MPKKDGTVHYPVVTDTRGALWLANQNCITPHVWTSRVPRLFHPDLCVFDLDPLEDDPAALRAATLLLARPARRAGMRELGEDVGLEGVSRRRAARRPREHRDEVSRFAHAVGARWCSAIRSISRRSSTRPIAAAASSSTPDATVRARRSRRRTPCARSRRRPVSAPCTWDEVESGRAEPRTFTLRTMAERLDAVGDLWADLHTQPCALPSPP